MRRMKMTSIKEAMESAGYEEISKEDATNARKLNIPFIYMNDDKLNQRYFAKKPEPKFPKIFRNRDYNITISDDFINIIKFNENVNIDFHISQSLPLLIEAVKYWETNKDD